MIITSIKIKIFKDSPTKMKGIASIVLDNLFVINEIKVVCSNGHLFLAMPSRETKRGEHKDITHPINETGRKIMEKAVLYVYQLAILHKYTILELEYQGSNSDFIFQFEPENYEIKSSKNSNDYLAVTPDRDTNPDDELTKWLES